jgi:hypothetical protein
LTRETGFAISTLSQAPPTAVPTIAFPAIRPGLDVEKTTVAPDFWTRLWILAPCLGWGAVAWIPRVPHVIQALEEAMKAAMVTQAAVLLSTMCIYFSPFVGLL